MSEIFIAQLPLWLEGETTTPAPAGHRQGSTQAAEGKKTEKVRRSEATAVACDTAEMSLCFASGFRRSQARENWLRYRIGGGPGSGMKGARLSGRNLWGDRSQMWSSSPCCYWIPGTDLRLAVLCKSISSMTGLSAFFGSSRIGIRSTMSLTKGTAAMCGAFSERLE